jgi:hypothetical protein
MRVHTKLTYQWSDADNNYVLMAEEGYDCPFSGRIALCKGATADQTNLGNSQSDFYKTLSQDYGTQFAQQGNILNSLNSALAPTVAAGASQFGYSPGQVNALNSTAIQGTAQQYQNAQKSLQNQQSSQSAGGYGGGNAYLPSGVASQNSAALAAQGANQTSSQLLGIQNAGYAQGNANYNNAVNALGGVASQYNPTGYAGQATGAGSSAGNTFNTIQQENTASSPLSIVGGILGGVATAAGGLVGMKNAGSGWNSLGGSIDKTPSSVNSGEYVPQ